MNDTKLEQENPTLLDELMQLLGKHQELYGQKRVFNRVLALVMAELFSFARHTITQLLLALGLTDEDWSAWYRLFSHERFKEEETAGVMLGEILAEVDEKEPLFVGADAFHVPRSSLKMPGTAYMKALRTAGFKSGVERGQRFVEGSWLTPLANGFSRAVPMRCLTAFTQKAVAGSEEPRTEVEAGLDFLQWLRSKMDEAGRSEQEIVTLNDGNFETLTFWPGLPAKTRGVVRTARNRRLFHLPAETAHGNCKYGERALAPREWLHKRQGFRRQEIVVRGRRKQIRYRVEGPFVREGLADIPLMLVVIGGGKRPQGSRHKSYDPSFYLVSAVLVDGVWSLPLPIAVLLVWLWQRWELEVAHRQMKSGFGLGEKQCWNVHSAGASVQWAVWVYSLMLLAGVRAWGNRCGPTPPGLWRMTPNRWSFNTLTRGFRAELWGNPKFRATWTWSRDNWLGSEPMWDTLFNSVLASARA